MDFLRQREVLEFKNDLKNNSAKQNTEKYAYERKLLEGLGEEMEDALDNPEIYKENAKVAKEYQRKKKWATIKENWKKIFGGN